MIRRPRRKGESQVEAKTSRSDTDAGMRRPRQADSQMTRPAAGSANLGAERPVRRRRPVKTAANMSSRQDKSLEGLGALLKTRREVKGFTRRDIVEKIKIPMTQLEAIEDGRLSTLPPVFAKGFLRAYANELGLNAEAMMEDYRQMTGECKNEKAICEPLSPRYVEVSVGPNRWRPSPRAIVVAALVLVAFVVALGVWPSFRNFFSGEDPPLTSFPGISSPLESELSYDREEDRGPTTTGSVSASLTAPSLSGEQQGSSPQRSGGTLTLSSQREGAWVQAVVDGNPPQYLLLENGQEVTLESREYIRVTSGMANAIKVTFDGQDLGFLGQNPIVETTFPKV